MANIVLNGKSVITQSSTDTPVLGPDILFPSGHIIQTFVKQFNIYDEWITSTPEAISGFSQSISVTQSTSKIHVSLYLAGAGKKDNNTSLAVQLTENSTGLDILLTNMIGFTNSTAYITDSAVQFYEHNHAQTAGTMLNYIPKFYSKSNNSKAFLNNYGVSNGDAKSYIRVQEISSGVLDPNPVAKRTWQTKTNSESGYTAVSGDRLFVDTSSGTVTVTLPASPAVGAFVRFVDVAGTFATNNLTIGRNSEKIMRSATDMTVSDSFSAFELVYSGSTHGWLSLIHI